MLNQINPFSNNVFQEAVMKGDSAIVSILLKFGVSLRSNQKNSQGLTALQQCVFDGNLKLAMKLLEAGADIEAKTANGWTCLHIASAVGEYGILCMLIEHCADLIALTKNNELPIDLACNRDVKVKLAQQMIRIGYDELAGWYLRKLAAREGAFYVISADALIDVACFNDTDSNSNYDGQYYLGDHPLKRANHLRNPTNAAGNSLVTSLKLRQQDRSPNSSPWSSPARLPGNPRTEQHYQWLLSPSTETMTYLSCSSGYLSEVIFNPSTGEYTEVSNDTNNESSNGKNRENSNISSSSGSPRRSVHVQTGSLHKSKSMLSVKDESPSTESSEPRYNTLKRNASAPKKASSSSPSDIIPIEAMQRKPSKIELFIDYSVDTDENDETLENDQDDGDDVFDDRLTRERSSQSPKYFAKYSIPVSANDHAHLQSPKKSKLSTDHATYVNINTSPSSSTNVTENSLSSSPKSRTLSEDNDNTLPVSPMRSSNSSTSSALSKQLGTPYDSRAVTRNSSLKNVRFIGEVDNNEYCNCPNCKKMGYALSPDLRGAHRKLPHEHITGYQPNQSNGSSSSPSYVYQPPQPASNYALGDAYSGYRNRRAYYESECDQCKPRKRKKNLFSGIVSMFKDTIKIQRSTSDTNLPGNDDGLVIAVSMREKSKAKAIKQRSHVRRSNSFSGNGSEPVEPSVTRSKSFHESSVAGAQSRYAAGKEHMRTYSYKEPRTCEPRYNNSDNTYETAVDMQAAMSHLSDPTHSHSANNSRRDYMNIAALPYANYGEASNAEDDDDDDDDDDDWGHYSQQSSMSYHTSSNSISQQSMSQQSQNSMPQSHHSQSAMSQSSIAKLNSPHSQNSSVHSQHSVSQQLQNSMSQHSQNSMSQHSQNSMSQHSQNSMSKHSQNSISQNLQNSIGNHSQKSMSHHSHNSMSQHSQNSMSIHSQNSMSQHSQNSMSQHSENALAFLSQVPSSQHSQSSIQHSHHSQNSVPHSGSSRKFPQQDFLETYDTQSIASDARINTMMSNDVSSSLHSETDHECDFCTMSTPPQSVQSRNAYEACQRKRADRNYSDKAPVKMFCS